MFGNRKTKNRPVLIPPNPFRILILKKPVWGPNGLLADIWSKQKAGDRRSSYRFGRPAAKTLLRQLKSKNWSRCLGRLAYPTELAVQDPNNLKKQSPIGRGLRRSRLIRKEPNLIGLYPFSRVAQLAPSRAALAFQNAASHQDAAYSGHLYRNCCAEKTLLDPGNLR